MITNESPILAAQLVERARERQVGLATAESCTGGLIGAAITDISGASAVFEGGFVTYSNEAKQNLLKVPAHLIEQFGAVSGEVAEAMAIGALTGMSGRADFAISVTGIAGPGGGSAEKPVGLVWFGIASSTRPQLMVHSESHIFDGLDREGVRGRTVSKALELLLQAISLAE